MNYIGITLFFLLIVAITDYQARTFAAGKSINHTLWTWIFGAIIVVFWISASDPWQDFFPLLLRNWVFLIDLILEHFVCFNPALNLWRKEKFFYINSDTHGSWFDKQFIALQAKWPGAYTAAWILAAATFIVLNIFYI